MFIIKCGKIFAIFHKFNVTDDKSMKYCSDPEYTSTSTTTDSCDTPKHSYTIPKGYNRDISHLRRRDERSTSNYKAPYCLEFPRHTTKFER